jgi:hypothetical protein
MKKYILNIVRLRIRAFCTAILTGAILLVGSPSGAATQPDAVQDAKDAAALKEEQQKLVMQQVELMVRAEFDKQDKRDALYPVTANSFFGPEFKRLPGAPVLVAVKVRTWESWDKGDQMTFDDLRGHNLVRLEIAAGGGTLLPSGDLKPGETQKGEAQLTLNASSIGLVSAWVLPAADSNGPIQVKAELLHDGPRKDFVGPQDTVLLDLPAAEAADASSLTQAQNAKLGEIDNDRSVETVEYVANPLRPDGKGGMSPDDSQSRRMVRVHGRVTENRLLKPGSGNDPVLSELKMPPRDYDREKAACLAHPLPMTHFDLKDHRVVELYSINQTLYSLITYDLDQPGLPPVDMLAVGVRTPGSSVDFLSVIHHAEAAKAGKFGYWAYQETREYTDLRSLKSAVKFASRWSDVKAHD